MCYNGKCLHCIPVEHGCLAFAIISAVLTGLALVLSIIAGLLTIAGVAFVTDVLNTGEKEDEVGAAAVVIVGITAGVFIGIGVLASLIAFIFSVLLCNGICNRRPGQVKAYFVYGVVVTVLVVLASVVAICTQQTRPFGIIGLIGCVIYSPILVMVHKTYAKLLERTVFAANGDRVCLEES